MPGFLKSFSPLLKKLKLKKYIFEIILLSVAIIITIISLIIYASNNQISEKQDQTLEASSSPEIINSDIFIDVSGAVKKPNLYQVDYGARIKDVVDKAGGLSDDADVIFFNRNFNLARVVTDQEKIYVPSIAEINNGIFIQNQLTLDYVSPAIGVINNAPTDVETSNLGVSTKINLNSATIEELDQLPGIGQVTANKIIANRPYSTLEELLTKKVVNKGVFEKVKNLISL
ncbi:MAG: hypothetical protein ACD_12C00567G0001 [uncultured bacterium]|nr:MAG: hypothetical protein ACD_12C00567G0001 [uncultured bacterium]